MILAVFDCGVLLSAIGWTGNPRRCLRLIADRQVKLCATAEIWDEYETRISATLAEIRPGVNPRPTLDYLLSIALFVEPAPLGKQRSRDKKDDPYLACAISANAEVIVSNDRDLLALKKPFGISIMTPVEFLMFVRGRSKI